MANIPRKVSSEEETLMNDAMKNAHEGLMVEEGASKNDPTEIATIHAFTDPREYRTMSKLDPGFISRLALVDAKGSFTHSKVRAVLVKNIFLMNRSAGGWGSNQAAEVAKSRSGSPTPSPRGWLFRTFGRKGEGQP